MKRLLPLALAAALVVSGCGKEPETEADLLKAGKKAFAIQKYDKARDYFGRLVRLHPSDREILYFLGMSYSKDVKYDSALFYLERLDRLHPNDREANLELYKIGMQTQDAKVAKDAIGVLIKTGDPLDMYVEDLAHLSMMLKQYALATRYFSLMIEDDPDKPQRYLDAANAAAGMDSFTVATVFLDSATSRFGRRPEFLLNKSLYLTAQKRFGESETILRELLAEDTANFGYRVNLAHVLASTDDNGKRREAYALYEQLKGRVDSRFGVDSLMEELGQKLGNVAPNK